MWKKIRLVNFRLFEDTKDLELAPLTFFIGPNGCGKSTLIKALLLLKQSAKSPHDDPLTPNGNLCELGHYPDYIHNGDTKKNLEIHVQWTPYPNPNGVAAPIGFSAIWSMEKENGKKRVVVKSFCYRTEKKTILKAERTPSKDYQLTSDYISAEEFAAGGAIDKVSKFFYLPAPHNPYFRGLNRDLDSLKSGLIQSLEDIVFQSALRETPRTEYKMPGPEKEKESLSYDLGTKGEDAFQVIGTWRPYQEKISSWLKKIGLANAIHIDNVGENIFSIIVSNVKTGFRSNLPYVGFGVPQVFPILAQGLWCEPGSTLMIEQPEIHLNPKMQAELADVFLELISSEEHRKQLIIETHSEHFLSRVRTRIADGSLDKEKVAVYYCDLDKNGGKIKRLQINDYGQFKNWPKGFFAEGIRETLKQTHAAFKRRSREAAKK